MHGNDTTRWQRCCYNGSSQGKETRMKAMVIVRGNQGGMLEWRDVPEPEVGPDELLMRVKAVAVNRGDVHQVAGTFSPSDYRTKATPGSAPQIPGQEAAGTVAGVGRNVSGFAIGDRIMGFCAGAYAEFATLDHRVAMPVPAHLSWEEATTIPVAYMTEHNALITCARLEAGETVLIHGVAAGVGVAAVQIAKLCGARLVMGTDSPEKFETLRALGMDIGINYRTESFADVVLNATNGIGVDVIIDHIGGPCLKDNLRCMAVKGRMVSVGRIAGGIGELDLDLMALKRLHLIGVTFRTRTIEERIAVAEGVIRDLLPALTDGRLRPVVDRVFRLEEAAEAQNYMLTNAQIGRIVLRA
jgi:NADPH:quinone reductase